MKNHYFQKVKTNLSRVNKLVDKAYDVLNGKLPESNDNCEYCKWRNETSIIEM